MVSRWSARPYRGACMVSLGAARRQRRRYSGTQAPMITLLADVPLPLIFTGLQT